jgi:membrane protease YdiL (CAAX protease family)
VSEGVGIVALNLALNILVAFLGRVVLDLSEGDSSSVTWLVVLIFTPYLLTFVAVLALMRRHGYSWSQGLGLRPMHILYGVGIAIGVAMVGRVFASSWTFVMAWIGFEPPANLDVTTWFPADPLGIGVLIAMTVIVAPFVEEIIYRGILFPSLRPTVGRTLAILLSAVVFGIAHLSLVWLMVPTAVLGMLLALAFEKTRSLRAAILGHALFNLTAVLTALFLDLSGAL